MNPYKFFFAIEYDFFLFFFVSSLSALSQFFFYCFCMLSKGDNHDFEKGEGEQINLKMHHTQVLSGLKKHKIK